MIWVGVTPMLRGGFGPPIRVLDGLTIPSDMSAYSTRLLRTDHTGPVIRLRRLSDSAEAEFGVDSSGQIDIAAIETWRGASAELFVVRPYDQSGNGLDGTPQAVATQPQFYYSGAYYLLATGEYGWSYTPQTSFVSAPRTIVHPNAVKTTTTGFILVTDLRGDTFSVLGGGDPDSSHFGPVVANQSNPAWTNSGASAQGYVDGVLVGAGASAQRLDWLAALPIGKHFVRCENVDMTGYTGGWRSAQYSTNGDFKSSCISAASIFYPTPPSSGDIAIIEARLEAEFSA